MGFNSNPFSVYDEVVAKLVDHIFPRHHIAIMGDADTDDKKQVLFDKVRQGSVRVLIGSTPMMGTGTNVQKRLVALHHLDAPWKPAEVEQRDGRILRQGNMNEEVSIFRYVTQGSFDAYMWQALETKARFISQVMSGDCAVRKAEDIGGQELSYAEVKAIASGNPAVLTLAATDAELQRLAILNKNHRDEQYLAGQNLKELPHKIKRLEQRIEGLTADIATAASHVDDPLKIGERTYAKDDAVAALGKRLNSLPAEVSETRDVRFGTYRGLEFGIILHKFGAPEAYLEGGVVRRGDLAREAGPRAVLNALGRLIEGYDDQLETAKRELAIAQDQLRDFQGRIGKPFTHEAFVSQLTDLRDQLKIGLSEHPPEGSTPVAELAERIAVLRAANTVEAAPVRAGTRKTTRAEVPVTARIRERMVEQAVQVDEKSAGHAGQTPDKPVQATPETAQNREETPDTPPAAVIAMPEPIRTMNGHAKAVVNRRQERAEQLRLF